MQVYQTYYDDKSFDNCFKQSIKVRCPNLTKKMIWETKEFPLFENHKIIEYAKDFNNYDKYGVLSHAFFNKSRKDYNTLISLSDTDYNIITFNKLDYGRDVMSHLDEYHGIGTKLLMTDILEEVRLKFKKTRTSVYSNYFLAKGDIYKDYVNNWLIPFSNELIKPKWDERSYKPARYKKAFREKGCDYPLHPFLLERLFSLYLSNNNYRIFRSIKQKNYEE